MDRKLTTNLEELERFFGTRMQAFEEKLKEATVSETSTSVSNTNTLSSEFSEFKSFILQTLTTMKMQIEFLTLGLDRHETGMRRKVLLFHGIEEKQDEKLHSIVSRILCDKMKLSTMSENVFQACLRLGSFQGKARPILVKFGSTEHRHTIWETKTKLKGSGITISEFLTNTRHRIFMAARQHFGLNRCWTVEGKIVVMVTGKTRRKIETSAELQTVITQFPATVATIEVMSPADPASTKNTVPAAVNIVKRFRRRM